MKIKGTFIVGTLVILLGSLVWICDLEITIHATVLAVFRGGGSTIAGGLDSRR